MEALLVPGRDAVIEAPAGRWHMLAIFSAVTFVNSFLWITFAPISSFTATYYGVTETMVNMLSMSFMLLYLPGSVACAWIIDAYDLRCNLIAAAVLNVAATVLRLASVFIAPSPAAYALLLTGQCLGAFVQPFVTNTPAKMGGEWFTADEQNVAVTIAALINPLGNAAGQVIPSLVVVCSDDSLKHCPDKKISGMFALLLAQGVMAVGAAVWCVVSFQAQPDHPPSEAALERRALRSAMIEHRSTSLDTTWSEVGQQLQDCCKETQFLFLSVSFGVGLGLFNSFLTVIEQVITPVFHTPVHVNGTTTYTVNEDAAQNTAGVYGGILIGAGLIGAACVGPLLDRYHSYKAVLKIALCGVIVVLFAFVLSLRPGDTWGYITGLCFGLIGFCMVPILPTALEAGVECTYPVPEEYSSGMLMVAGQLFGIGMTFAMPVLIDMQPNWYTWDSQFTPLSIFLLASAGFGGFFMLIFNGEYKKLAAEEDAARAAKLDTEVNA